jgi:hypothetical protein
MASTDNQVIKLTEELEKLQQIIKEFKQEFKDTLKLQQIKYENEIKSLIEKYEHKCTVSLPKREINNDLQNMESKIINCKILSPDLLKEFLIYIQNIKDELFHLEQHKIIEKLSKYIDDNKYVLTSIEKNKLIEQLLVFITELRCELPPLEDEEDDKVTTILH